MSIPLTQYRVLRDRIDTATGRLVDMHCKHLACRPGCHDCCTDFTVSAVEYRAILDDLLAAGVTRGTLAPSMDDAACAFLTAGGLCALYRFRPLICRTHGLPIAFDAEDELGHPIGKNVSFCPKNFTTADPDDLAFGPGNTLDLDELNETLSLIAADHERLTGETGRVPLRQLRDDLPPEPPHAQSPVDRPEPPQQNPAR